jgi:hypothetical protein
MQMAKPISRSLKERLGKQESFLSSLSFMRKLRMFIGGGVAIDLIKVIIIKKGRPSVIGKGCSGGSGK